MHLRGDQLSCCKGFGVYANALYLLAGAIAGPILAARMLWSNEVHLLQKALILALVSAAATVAVGGILYAVGGRNVSWIKPSIKRPFYVPGGPLQVAYLGALGFPSMAVGCIISLLWGGEEMAWLFFLSLGAGFFTGQRFVGLAFVDRQTGP